MSQLENSLTPKTPAAPRGLAWWMLALIFAVALGVYANSLWNQFAYDDCGVISDNPRVMELQWTEIWNKGYWPEWEGTPDVLYRPLTIWSYAANQATTPTTQWAFHGVNVLLNATISVLVGILAWRLLRSRPAALITGILFALHPLHTEAVSNVVGRAELLAALWSLLTLLVMLPESDLLAGPGAKRSWFHGWIVAACFILAMFSKETPAALLGAILFLDIWRWIHWTTRPRLWRWLASQTARYYFPLATVFAIYMAMRLHAVGFMSKAGMTHPMVNPLLDASVTLGQRIVTPFVLIAKYLTLMAWPKVLLADYSAPSIMPTSNPFGATAALGILLVVAWGLIIVKSWKKRPGIAAALVLMAFSYILAANFLRIGTIFGERLFYLPSAFVLMLVATVAVGIWTQLKNLQAPKALRVMAAGAALAICGLLGARTVIRNPDWKDNIDLALATAADNPNSSKALCWAGQIIAERAPDAKALDFAVGLLVRASELYPTNGQTYWELAKHYDRVNQIDKSVIYLAIAARFYAGKAETRYALTGAREDMSHHDPKDYIPAIVDNLNANPKNPAANFAAGLASWANNDLPKAEEFIRRALALDPDYEEARMELGLLRAQRGDPLDALTYMQKYIVIAGYNIKARCQYIDVLLKVDAVQYPQALDEAERQYIAATHMLATDPSLADLGRAIAVKRSAQQARRLAPEPPVSAVLPGSITPPLLTQARSER